MASRLSELMAGGLTLGRRAKRGQFSSAGAQPKSEGLRAMVAKKTRGAHDEMPAGAGNLRRIGDDAVPSVPFGAIERLIGPLQDGRGGVIDTVKRGDPH